MNNLESLKMVIQKIKHPEETNNLESLKMVIQKIKQCEEKTDSLFESYRQTGLEDDYRRYTIAVRQLGIATQQYHKLAE